MLRMQLAAVAGALALLLPTVSATAAERPRWEWPVPAPHPVVRDYVAPSTPYGAGHRGVDVAVPAGTPVLAPDDGVVVWAARIVDRGVVAIEHAGGVRSSLEPVDPRVRVGERVVRGQVVALAATGGAHRAGLLHLGARIRGAYVSPLLLLGTLRRAVLLPLDG